MTGAPRRRVDGVLLLDKPRGLSSNAALQRVKRLYRADKAGHTGTLDPLATGVLPICFGEATKFANGLLDADKAYRATLRLGITTTTGDAEGEVVAQRPVEATRADLEAVLARLRGRIAQIPPRHSALKRNGRSYYEYARRGIEIERAPREVEIHALALIAWRADASSPAGAPEVVLDVRCGKGTYVRALAEDIGEALGCGAHLCALVRTAAGEFTLEQTRSLEALEAGSEAERDDSLLPVDAMVRRLERIDVDGADARRLGNGQALVRANRCDAVVRVYADGAFAGVAEIRGGVLRARRLLARCADAEGEPARPEVPVTRLIVKHFSS